MESCVVLNTRMVANRGRSARRRGSLMSFRGMMTCCAFLLGTLSLSVSISHFMCSLWSTSHGFRGAALPPSILEDYNPKDYAVADLSRVGFIKDRNQTQKIVDESNWKTRVYCMVPTLYAPHQINLMTAIANGWGAYCDEIKFFVDPPTDGKGMVLLPCITSRWKEIQSQQYESLVLRNHAPLCYSDIHAPFCP